MSRLYDFVLFVELVETGTQLPKAQISKNIKNIKDLVAHQNDLIHCLLKNLTPFFSTDGSEIDFENVIPLLTYEIYLFQSNLVTNGKYVVFYEEQNTTSDSSDCLASSAPHQYLQ